MSLAARLGNLLTWRPPAAGAPTPDLSLTAQDGTWIRMTDYAGERPILLVFLGKADGQAAKDWLRALDAARPQIEEMGAAVFGVCTLPPDRLRPLRDALGLGFALLFDPLAVDGRRFRASSRWRPVLKDNVVLVGKDGQIAWAVRGLPPVREVLQALAESQGLRLEAEREQAAAAADRREVRQLDSLAAVALLQAPDSPWILVDVRTLSEFEADHAPQAIHIPVDELPQRYEELGQTDHILCVCQAGSRSAAASEFLASLGGAHIGNVQGGMSAWAGPRVTGGLSQ